MGTAILRGISTSLLVTVITLLAGIFWNAMGFGGLNASNLVDIGLFASCIVGGYRAGKEEGSWISGGIAGAGFVTVGVMLLALFLPVQVTGALQVLAEGAIISSVAGVFGAQTSGVYKKRPAWNYSPGPRRDSIYDDDEKDDYLNNKNSNSYTEDEEWLELGSNSNVLTFPSEGKRQNRQLNHDDFEYDTYREEDKYGDDYIGDQKENSRTSKKSFPWWEEELSQR